METDFKGGAAGGGANVNMMGGALVWWDLCNPTHRQKPVSES